MINKKINKILVPLDGSKNSIHALEMAISIARQFGATITGAYSTNIQPHSEFQGVIVNKELDNEIKKMMANAKVISAQNGIVFKEKLMRGDTGYNLIRLAHDKKRKIQSNCNRFTGKKCCKRIIFRQCFKLCHSLIKNSSTHCKIILR